MLQAIRLFLFFLSLFLYFVRVDAFGALISFLALAGTFHYVLWGRAMELESEEVDESGVQDSDLADAIHEREAGL